MDKQPIWGLRARIVFALAVVFALFIIATELSISELVRVTMVRQADQQGKPNEMEELNKFNGHEFAGLRKLILFYMIFGAAISILLGFIFVSRLVVRPLTQITGAVEKVAGGYLETQVPIRGSGELIRLGVAFNRMTTTLRDQRKELSSRLEELEASARDLQTAQDGLIRSAKLASVGTLAAGVAHEIGNPLAGILGLLDALEQDCERETEIEYRNLMRRELNRIDKIIADLITYARPGETTDSEQDLSAPLNQVIDHVLALLKAQKIFDKIDIEVHLPPAPLAARISRGNLTQIFINLLLNAAQAMEGSGMISVEASTDPAPAERNGGPRKRIQILVSDTGPGVSSTHRDRIFEPFFSRRMTGEGAGLGLAICQSICERAGGEIHYQPAEKGGARFEIVLDCQNS